MRAKCQQLLLLYVLQAPVGVVGFFSPGPGVGSFLQVEQKEAGMGYQRYGMAFREQIKSVWILQPQKEMSGVHVVKPWEAWDGEVQ